MPKVIVGKELSREAEEAAQAPTAIESPSAEGAGSGRVAPQTQATHGYVLSLPQEVVETLQRYRALLQTMATDEQDRQMITQLTAKKLKAVLAQAQISDEDKLVISVLASVLGLCRQ